MNITSDVNKNIDLLSCLKNEEQNSTILNKLFSINVESDVVSEGNTDEEFIFKDNEVAIINYLSNLIPNFQNENKNLSDLKKIKKQIEIDLNINPELKENILKFLREEKFSFKNFNINILNKRNFYNKKSTDNLENSKTIVNQKHISDNFAKSENNSISGKQLNISNNFENIDGVSQNIKNKNTQFVKKIEKNNHPNKIYQLPQSNALKYRQLNEITSHVDQKIIDNNNFLLINNQINEGPKNNKTNEIKMNNYQISNVQQSIQGNNSGTNFSHQNDSSLTNSGYNSVLENFFDNLDLTQKGWTSKLASRIEKAIQNGGEEIEFNLKPKNLGLLKVSVKFKNGVGNVKIVTENSFVTSALNQNENYLQKLFNEQGINLDFSAQNEGKKFDSRNNSNQNSQNNDKKNSTQSDINIKNSEDESDIIAKNNSSRHMINVIA